MKVLARVGDLKTTLVGAKVAIVERCNKIQTLPQGSSSFESRTKIFYCHSQGKFVLGGLRNKAEKDNSWTPTLTIWYCLSTRQYLLVALILKL